MRVAFHAINGVGLGHLVRLRCLAHEVRVLDPAAEILFLTNARDVSLLERDGFDFVRFPPRLGEPHADPQRVFEGLADDLDAAACIGALGAFAPDLAVFDTHAPAVVVRAAADRGARVVLVLRELRPDAWRAWLASPATADFDRILVPHEADEVDPASLPTDLPIELVGPVVRDVPRLARGASSPSAAPRVVVLAGGGGQPVDALRFLRAAADAHWLVRARVASLATTIVAGPHASRLPRYDGLTVLATTPDSLELAARADLIVSQAGYNAIGEIRALRKPAVLVPAIRRSEDQSARVRRVVAIGAAVRARPEARSIANRVEALLTNPGRLERMAGAHARRPLVPRNREAAESMLRIVRRPLGPVRRVVLVAHDFPPRTGGMETVAREVAAGLVRQGLEVVVYTTRRIGPCDVAGVRVRRMFTSLADPRNIDLLRDLLLTLDAIGRDAPDAVHLCHAGLAPWIPALRAAWPATTIVSVHGNDLLAPWVQSGTTDDAYRTAITDGLRAADRVVAVSEFSAGVARAQGADPGRISVVPNGVDSSVFSVRRGCDGGVGASRVRSFVGPASAGSCSSSSSGVRTHDPPEGGNTNEPQAHGVSRGAGACGSGGDDGGAGAGCVRSFVGPASAGSCSSSSSGVRTHDPPEGGTTNEPQADGASRGADACGSGGDDDGGGASRVPSFVAPASAGSCSSSSSRVRTHDPPEGGTTNEPHPHDPPEGGTTNEPQADGEAGALAGRGSPAVLLTVSRLAARKGHETVLRALPSIPGVRYVFTGVHERIAAGLGDLARRLGVGARVTGLGFVPDADLPDLYRSARVFVLVPDERDGADVEGFGVALLEAAACGLPVVASRTGGIPEAVEDGVTGLLVPPGDVAATAAAIRALLDDPQRAAEMGRRGRERVVARFSWDATCAGLRAALEGAAPRPDAAGTPREEPIAAESETRAVPSASALATLHALVHSPPSCVDPHVLALRDAIGRVQSVAALARLARFEVREERAQSERRRATNRRAVASRRRIRLRATGNGERILAAALDECRADGVVPDVEVRLRRFLDAVFRAHVLPATGEVFLHHSVPALDPPAILRSLRSVADDDVRRVRSLRIHLSRDAESDGGLACVPEVHALREHFASHGVAVLPPPEIMRYLSVTPAGTPPTAMIEPTNRCNLACPTCPTGTGKIAPLRDMDPGRFATAISGLVPGLRNLALWNYGEPTLNRHLPRMIAEAKRRGVGVVKVSSNVHFLDGERATALLDSGLDVLILSVDGASEETYSKFRVRGDFARVAAAVRGLCAEKSRRGLARPRIELQFIAMRHNEHEVPEIRRLAAEWGVDRLRIKTFGAEDGVNRDLVPDAPDLSRYGDDRATPNRSRPFCTMAWDHTVVNVDGSVTPCCYLRPDMGERFVMGNVFRTPFAEIWRGARYRDFREAMLRDRGAMPVCDRCRGGTHDLLAAVEEVQP